MIPQHLKDSIEDRTNFIHRLLIRKKAVNIVEILLFFNPIIQGKHFGILESVWRQQITLVERFLCKDKKHLAKIQIGDVGLRKPSSGLIHILRDCDFFNRQQPRFQQPPPESLRKTLEESRNYLERILLRQKAQLIAEILLFFEEYFFKTESFITCSQWKEAVRLTENSLLTSQPELKNISITRYGFRKPTVPTVLYIHDCREANC